MSITGLFPGWWQDLLYCKDCFLKIPKGQKGQTDEGVFAVFINSISYIYCIPNVCGLYDKKIGLQKPIMLMPANCCIFTIKSRPNFKTLFECLGLCVLRPWEKYHKLWPQRESTFHKGGTMTGRIAGTEDKREDSESQDGVQGVAGDAARVLAVSNEAHVPAFPPTGPPTEKSFKKRHVEGTAADTGQSWLWCFSPDLFLMSQ